MNSADFDYFAPDFDTGEPIHVGRWFAEGVKHVWQKRLNGAADRLAGQLSEQLGKSIAVSINETKRCLVVTAKRLTRDSVPAEFEGLAVVRG